ncbi:conserved exported hypothetical protein [uncultured Paludibacter sp.]|nr:conserved exported hypothetical protein [uncultured Paludibacter sp.]
MQRSLLIILLCGVSVFVSAQDGSKTDTIVYNAMNAAEKTSKLIENYDAETYMRTYILTLKKNFLYKYAYLIPDFVLYDRKNNEAVIETFNTVHFQYPNNYEYEVKNINGTLTSKKDILMLPFNFLNINVYDITTNDGSFIMPIRFETRKYYRYRYQNTFSENGKTYYTIQFLPVYSSSKLLKGSFTVEDETWRITDFFGIGNDLFVDFSFNIKMGKNSLEKYLPVEFQIYRTHLFMGNKIQNRYLASIDYTNIQEKENISKTNKFDIGNRYKLRLDSVPIISEKDFWNKKRKTALYNKEQALLEKIEKSQEEVVKSNEASDSVSSNHKRMQLIAQSIISEKKYHYKKTDIHYSGFLNPWLLSYSTQDGLNYRFRLSFDTHLIRHKSLEVSTSFGYAFKYRDLVTDMSMAFNYNTSRFGNVSFSAGKGNNAFSSLFLLEVQDSLRNKGLKFEDVFLNYYKDYYYRLYNNIEIVNGFQVRTGVDYHIRQANKKTNLNYLSQGDENELLDKRYYFVPTIRFTWTPAQYYRREGYQKIYEHSNYPTFKAEYAHCFNNVLGSNSEYDRFEFDISHKIPIGLLQFLQYHVGTGFYARQKTEYFTDFTYFARYNIPETWKDGIGGVFNLLPYSVYNASTSYAQAHIMYETPFFIFTLLPKLSRGMLSERVYLSQLYTPYIVSYSEIGYGIGNRFVNAAFFGSFHKLNFLQVGVKVVFLLPR